MKVSLAARLRAERTVTLDWIAKRLTMDTRGHLAHLLYLHEHARSEPPPQDQPKLNIWHYHWLTPFRPKTRV